MDEGKIDFLSSTMIRPESSSLQPWCTTNNESPHHGDDDDDDDGWFVFSKFFQKATNFSAGSETESTGSGG